MLRERVGVKPKKNVIILIGPKGCGKTFIGRAIEKCLGVIFIPMEPLLIDYLKNNPSVETPLPRHGFDIEEQAVRDTLRIHNSVVFEATGSSVYFPSVIGKLTIDFNVRLVRVLCPLSLCYDRVKNREQDGHFIVDEKKLIDINERAHSAIYDWDLEIKNDGTQTENDLLSKIGEYFLNNNIH